MPSYFVREYDVRVRQLRMARGWSQAQLAELSGLSIRTVQRIENGADPSLESLRALAAVLQVDPSELSEGVVEGTGDMSFVEAVRHCLEHFADFKGVAGRPEFWWFALAYLLAVAIGAAVGPWLRDIIALVLLLPLLAAATRRLRDAGQSPWWLLFLLAPVGGLVVNGYLLSMPSVDGRERAELRASEAGRS